MNRSNWYITVILYCMMIGLLSLMSCNKKEYPRRCAYHTTNFEIWDSVKISEVAKAELIIFSMERCYKPSSQVILQSIRAHNSDIKIIGYLGVLNQCELWPDTTGFYETNPFAIDMWNATKDDFVYTTEGELFYIWPDCMFLNPIKGDSVNTDLIDKILNAVEKNLEVFGSIDGVFHDYLMRNIYVMPTYEGDLDLDGDGVPWQQDIGEHDLLWDWQLQYVQAFTERFGEGFLQVGNGYLPVVYSEMTRELNGIFYELYPITHYSWTEHEALLQVLSQKDVLKSLDGKIWSVISGAADRDEYNMLVSMLTSDLYAERVTDGIWSRWYEELDAGRAKGELKTYSNGWEREFSKGTVHAIVVGEKVNMSWVNK